MPRKKTIACKTGRSSYPALLGWLSVFLACLVSFISHARAEPTVSLITDSEFEKRYFDDVIPFWNKQVSKGTFRASKGISLSYVYAVPPNPQGTVVVLPGFRETFLKYRELMYNLYQNGIAVWSYDHRGQGTSPRILANSLVSYVDSFDDYVNDLHIFVEDVVAPQTHGKIKLFGHSMGGGIATRLLEKEPGLVQGAVLAAPMNGILALAKLPTNFIFWYLQRALTSGRETQLAALREFASVQDPFPFFTSSSTQRRKVFAAEVQTNPNIIAGEPSFRWVWEAWRACDLMQHEASKIRTPTLILQSGHEIVVDNKAQDTVCNQASHCRVSPFPRGWHEVWNEEDETRLPALTQAIEFLKDEVPLANASL